MKELIDSLLNHSDEGVRKLVSFVAKSLQVPKLEIIKKERVIAFKNDEAWIINTTGEIQITIGQINSRIDIKDTNKEIWAFIPSKIIAISSTAMREIADIMDELNKRDNNISLAM